jgi:hypothetical protein
MNRKMLRPAFDRFVVGYNAKRFMTIKLRPSISTLLFDWDGTIVDSAHLGLAAYQKTFAELDAAFSQEIYEATYSPQLVRDL